MLALSVWADARGVFALTSDRCVPEGGDLPYCNDQSLAAAGASIMFNDGAGWRSLLDVPQPGVLSLAGFPDGPLVLTTEDCSAKLFDIATGISTCSLPVDTNTGPSPARVFVGGPNQAYAIEDDEILEYDAGGWHTVIDRLPEPVAGMWGDANLAYFAGAHQPYSWRRDSGLGLVPLPNAPAAFYTAVWGLAADDVWFGNAAGQLVHDERGSYQVFQASSAYEPIRGIWGQGDQLFYYTRSTFGRLSHGQVERIIEMTTTAQADEDLEILAMWGTSPQQVFIALAEQSSTTTEDCNARFMLYFDGQELHRF